jgi:cellulose synthase/poly-beta-1,6-N-acetylglucosamine synthase-like glycosyltransferase
MAELVFWGAAFAIVFAYLGFPLVLLLRATLWPAPPLRRGDAHPTVSYVIVAYNEVDVIGRKLDNVFSMDFPSERLQVILASDGSTDGTVEAVRAHPRGADCLVLDLPRGGKNATLNAAVGAATGEILVFSDADSMLEPHSLRALLEPLSDPSVGGVAGHFEYEDPERKGEGERAYWSVDRIWKRLESRGGQLTSATGQIYAIRASLFTPVPDGVTDDFFVSTGVIAAGLRLVFEERAVAHGPVAESAEVEFRRKVRVAGRGLASAWARRILFDPRRYGFYSLQLFTHKVLRRLVGLPLVVLLFASFALVGTHLFYALACLGQLTVHLLAGLGWWLRDRPIGRNRVFTIPLYFDLVNLAGSLAFVDFVRGKRHLHWSPERSPEAAKAPGASA